MTELTSAVRAAQADAERRFGEGPAQAWEPPPVLTEATRRRLAVVAVTSLLATALLVAVAVARTPTPVAQVEPGRAIEAASPSPADEQPPADADEGEGEGDEPGTRARDATTSPHLSLERHGAEWRLSATDASRLDVAQRLAEASGSALRGSPDSMRQLRPLQLQWQGRSLAQLWPRVLGPELNFALQCRRERCEVWILGPAGAAVAATAWAARPSQVDEPASLPMPVPMPAGDDDDAQRD